ncbi:MAG: helix-turn-helix transcriptional regulator [Microcystis sp. M015S2]|jgi:ArsR family transcriptional regulator|uniref:Helix-turn-helix transcriptional regulator n=8 Tax=Microcystis TaxID=1125 RepID=A0A841V3E2_MICAE|nr:MULTISPECIES: metalloregulator ArsR/SmtB family transcription factor [Microcystis]MCA2818343.1 helix-turn-helix transcriptional regulator [Microcystis sp. M085S1]MCA2856814.1 helix-turn-helix transcriptional regulator [Microcystis sp. M065S1]MCZ8159609.1 metalloregulator ArsR/SmtB family transcription factor [Microcystis sp. LE19-196.1B]MCZ8272323.1 metalloregulator ArsR/SmtB family transcription factor [Microcystis sp. LE19-4.1E]NCR79822.1 helix-turn-helix transcriptional regulator [Microc
MFNSLTTSPDSLTQIYTGFQALSDPLRLQILQLLRHQELCVCELRDHLDIAQSKLSFHLKTLKEANLVRSRQEGRWIYYSLNLSQFLLLEEYLSEYRRFSSLVPARFCEENQ